MNIKAAMLLALLLLLVTVAITFAIYGIVRLLAEHPVALFSVVAAVLFVILTICFYVGGNAT